MTRTDFHRNLFYYYRGPVTSTHFATQQVENNTTKALINLLEHASDKVRGEFLRFLEVRPTNPHLDLALQTTTIGERRIRDTNEKLLLEIVRADGTNGTASLEEPRAGTSLPDAWIYNNDVVILVESKLGANLNPDQHTRHMRLLGPNTRRIRRTWQDIHDSFLHSITAIPNLSDVDRLLLHQFTKYLEYTCMATARTVDAEIFDFLFHPEDERGRTWVRETMKGLATFVRDAVEPSLQVKVGNLQEQEGGWYSCWVTLSRSPRASEDAHLTIELMPYELTIFANVGTSTVKRLLNGLSRAPGTFQEMLAKLDEFYVSIHDRVPVRPRVFDYVPVMEFRTGRYIADDYSFNQITHLLQCLRAPGTYPSFSVKRKFDRHEVLEKKDEMASALVQAAQQLQKVVQFINSGGAEIP